MCSKETLGQHKRTACNINMQINVCRQSTKWIWTETKVHDVQKLFPLGPLQMQAALKQRIN